MYKNLIISAIFVLACSPTWRDRVYKEDKEFILKGRYPYQMFSIGRKGGEYEDIIKELREEIEKDPVIFDKIVETYFDIYHPPFIYHVSMIDKEKSNLIIRYFARFLRRRIYAGIGIQFVYSLKGKNIEKIYVDLVPLE